MPINVANVVTVLRVLLALGTVACLWLNQDEMRWTAFGLTILVVWADGIDGFLARKLNQASRFGGILDIAGDRVVELTYWTAFAILNWIPAFVPFLFVVRGIFVDSIRSYASEQGYTAFGKNTMIKSPIGKFLVASNFSRFTYAVAKAVAFCIVIAAHTRMFQATPIVADAGLYLVYFTCVFCIIRGLPVILESSFLFGTQDQNQKSS